VFVSEEVNSSLASAIVESSFDEDTEESALARVD
jgi:hypothetical protein